MAYSELIKNFDGIRDYMREFYLYGFKSRNEYTKKSARSYDDERRRVESWLKDYMGFRQTPEGKNIFISIDSRVSRHNPLYAAWKTKSFTDGDITLHFILFDILHDSDTALTLAELSDEIDEYLSEFGIPRMFDESTIRKKLKEYEAEGIVIREKRGKAIAYRRAEEILPVPSDVLDFFSETAACGVIGSFLLDKYDAEEGPFTFKHHYITSALDSEILCSLLTAIEEKRSLSLEVIQRRDDRISERQVVPLQIRSSVQGGRDYLMAYVPRLERISSIRVDNIISVKTGEVCERYEQHRGELEEMLPHLWGVSVLGTAGDSLEHVEFVVQYTEDETHIPKRLEREKRCGTVEMLDGNRCRFSADVYDSIEMLPWIRTFICRIISFECSNKAAERRFQDDLEQMYALYRLEGGEGE